MKKKSLNANQKRWCPLLKNLSLLVIVFASFGFSFFPRVTVASSDLDRQYRLETIGVLRAYDNIDGLFGDYVEEAYRTYFQDERRFIYNDLSRASKILDDSRIPYSDLIHDQDILEHLARTTRTESLLRTVVVKDQDSFRFTIEWLLAPKMVVLSSHEFQILAPKYGRPIDQNLINREIKKNLMKVFYKVPILANVTGRDGMTLTLNVGIYSEAQPGDEVRIATLETVKTHPLLKKIVDWEFADTGRAVIEEIEDGMAFARITQESNGKEILRQQKVIGIRHQEPKQEVATSQATMKEKKVEPPRLGYLSGGALVGIHQWQFSTPSSSTTRTGGGFAFGGKGKGEVWINDEFFLTAEVRYSTWGFSQRDPSTGTLTTVSQNGGVSGSLFALKGEVGYAFFSGRSLLGPKAYAKVGFRSASYTLPASTTEFTGPISLTSFLIGIGGEYPLRDHWGALASLNFRVFSMTTADWIESLSGESLSGAVDVDFFAGGYYRFDTQVTVRAGIDVLITGVDLTGGTSVSQKTITIGPSLLYYF